MRPDGQSGLRVNREVPKNMRVPKALCYVRTYATTMLDTSATTFFGAQNFHQANIVLGRVALAENDVELAKYYLLEAGRIPESSSPASPGPMQLQGPNMRLASELLQRGESDVVLEYFGLCSRFWHSDKPFCVIFEDGMDTRARMSNKQRTIHINMG